MRLRVHLAGPLAAPIAGLVCLGGCAPDSAPAVLPDQRLQVDVMIEPSGLRVVSIADGPSGTLGTPRSEGALGYVLEAHDGTVVARGGADDPRVWRSEWLDGVELVTEHSAADFGLCKLNLPTVDGVLVLSEQTAEGPREIGRVDFQPGLGKRESPLGGAADVLGPPVRIAGNAEVALDIMVMSEGYTSGEMAKFASDADTLMKAFLSQPAVAGHQKKINVWRLDVLSRETGVDDPDADVKVDTAFDVSFGKGDFHRRVTSTPKGVELARSLAGPTADVIVLLVNHVAHGGSGSGNFIVTTANQGTLGGTVLAHEFGHAVMGLADEYDIGSCDKKKKAPNISKSPDRDELPWADLVAPSTPLPTPLGTPGVGAFEGGSYCQSGIWRPVERCLMRQLDAPFCPVCARELDRVIAQLGQPAPSGDGEASPAPPETACPVEWRGDGVCDACLGDDPDCDGPYCPVAWYADGICDWCLGDDPDCAAAP